MLILNLISLQEHLYSTGENKYGQVGANLSVNNKTVTQFQRVDLNEEIRPKQISVGLSSIMMVTGDGELYAWGANQYKQLSFDDNGNFIYPQLVEYFTRNNISVDQASVGAYSSFVLDNNNTIYSIGSSNKDTCRNDAEVVKSLSLNLSENEKITTIQSQNYLTLFLSDQGNIYFCGTCEFGILCKNSSKNSLGSLNLGNIKVSDMYYLPDRLFLVTTSNEIYAIGNNDNGQLCVGNSEEQIYRLTKINFEGRKLVQAVGGYTHTLLLDDKGTLYGCGNSSHGQLGQIREANFLVPTALNLSSYGTIKHISATYNGSLILTTKGLFISGQDSSGELGSGTIQTINYFKKSSIEKDITSFQYLASNVKNTFVYGLGPKISTSVIMGYVFLALFLAIAVGISTYFIVKFVKERKKNKYKYSMAADDDEW